MTERRDERDPGTLEQVGEQLGAAAGKMMGRGSDVATDLIGSLVGSAARSLGDWWSSADASRASRAFETRAERSCRDHFQSDSSGARQNYDEVRPLYQFGHMASQNPEYRGRDFDEIEPDLQRAWEGGEKRSGEWPAIRGYVGFGFAQGDSNPNS